MGASNHAIELFCIRCGRVLGFLYFNTLIWWLIVSINGQTIIYVVVILRICNSFIAEFSSPVVSLVSVMVSR